jgi:hypothetical protein
MSLLNKKINNLDLFSKVSIIRMLMITIWSKVRYYLHCVHAYMMEFLGITTLTDLEKMNEIRISFARHPLGLLNFNFSELRKYPESLYWELPKYYVITKYISGIKYNVIVQGTPHTIERIIHQNTSSSFNKTFFANILQVRAFLNDKEIETSKLKGWNISLVVLETQKDVIPKNEWIKKALAYHVCQNGVNINMSSFLCDVTTMDDIFDDLDF